MGRHDAPCGMSNMRHRSQPWLNNISLQNKTMKGRSIQRFSLENTIQTIVPIFWVGKDDLVPTTACCTRATECCTGLVGRRNVPPFTPSGRNVAGDRGEGRTTIAMQTIAISGENNMLKQSFFERPCCSRFFG